MISEYTVPWIAAESGLGFDLGMKWIKSNKENIASSGWSSLSSYLALTPDEQIDLSAINALLKKVEKEIHTAKNRERYTMNGFVIAVGSYVRALTATALLVAKEIAAVEVDMSETACKLPSAYDYIKKIEKAGKIGAKRKKVRC
jgi:hypothetical protein